jgi:hypothetical protein
MNMETRNLEEKLGALGLPLMVVQKQEDVNQTLAEVVQSQDTRYWEGFPVLLVSAYRTGNFKTEGVEAYLRTPADVRKWRSLLKMSLALYWPMKKRFAFAERMEKSLSTKEKEWVNEFRRKARTRLHDNFVLENKKFSFSRMKALLENYMQEETVVRQQSQAKYDDFSLEYALSQLFSPKQKELFKKKLDGKFLSKTEREYFSRTVKKKVLALANPQVHRLAQKLLS